MTYIDLLRLIGLALTDNRFVRDFEIEMGTNPIEVSAVRFSYHKKRFRVTLSLHVEEVQGKMLAGTDAALALYNCLHAIDQLDDARNVLRAEATA